jgi:hypothetical protein
LTRFLDTGSDDAQLAAERHPPAQTSDLFDRQVEQ